MPESVTLRLETAKLHESLAARAAELSATGASVSTISLALNTTWETANEALAFADSGEVLKPPGRRIAERSLEISPVIIRIANDVARMRDVELMSFREIAKHFHVTAKVVTEAWTTPTLK